MALCITSSSVKNAASYCVRHVTGEKFTTPAVHFRHPRNQQAGAQILVTEKRQSPQEATLEDHGPCDDESRHHGADSEQTCFHCQTMDGHGKCHWGLEEEFQLRL